MAKDYDSLFSPVFKKRRRETEPESSKAESTTAYQLLHPPELLNVLPKLYKQFDYGSAINCFNNVCV